MDSHKEAILNAFPVPKSDTELLIKINYQAKLPESIKTRNEVMCCKCLTPWSLGKFTATMIPANHRRKKRRQFRIERLQQQIKSDETSKTDVAKLTRKLKRLQQLNNHVAQYKCFCKAVTKVVLKKPAVETTKKTEELVKTDVASLPEKKIKKKKKKTAGLIIPVNYRSTSPKSASKSKGGLTAAQLSNLFSSQKKQVINKPKFSDFL